MMETVSELKETIALGSKRIDALVHRMWKGFYGRLQHSDYPCDRAIWITRLSPTWIAVFPGSVNDDGWADPPFGITLMVTGADNLSSDEFDALCDRYVKWANASISRVWQSPSIQRVHQQMPCVTGKFAVYSTAIHDFRSHEIDQMTRLLGDDLVADESFQAQKARVRRLKRARTIKRKVVKKKR